MSKRKKHPDAAQLNIFELVLRDRESPTCSLAPGSCNIDAEFRAAVASDLRRAADENGRELSRPEVAARMAVLTGDPITDDMLYNWTADSHRKHNMPAKYISAFSIATGCRQAIDVLSRRSGLFTLPGPEALRAEIHRIGQEIKKKEEEVKKRELLLEEVNRK